MDPILREFIFRWQRAAVLFALLFIALIIWVPVLIQASLDETEELSNLSTVPKPIPVTTRGLESGSGETLLTVENRLEVTSEPNKLNHTRQPDPLVRSMGVTAFRSSELHRREVSHSHLVRKNDSSSADQLILTGITAGTTPPTATINGKEYTPGNSIKIRGETYQLNQIRNGTVELKRGREVILLRLENSETNPSGSQN